MQVGAVLVVDHLGVAREFDHAAFVRFADDVAARAQAVMAQHVHHFGLLVLAHLDHGAQFFSEQRGDGQFIAARGHLAGPVLGVTPVGGVAAFHGQDVEVDRQAAAAGEGHLAQRGEQAAVGAVMVGEQFAFGIELLNRAKQAFQVVSAVDVRHFITKLLGHGRQCRSTQAVLAAAKVDQNHGRLALVHEHLRRERTADVLHRRERRDDQRHRRSDGLLLAFVVPGGAHRQRVFADRDADPQCRA